MNSKILLNSCSDCVERSTHLIFLLCMSAFGAKQSGTILAIAEDHRKSSQRDLTQHEAARASAHAELFLGF